VERKKKVNSSNALKFSTHQIDEARHHIFFQHDGADGFITLAKKENGKFIQRHYRPEQLAEQLTNYMGEDIYYSQNTFYKPQRRIENIRQLRNLYIDLDCYLFNYDPDFVVRKLELEYFKQSIPEPNLIIFSGRGVVLVWLIEPVPYKALPLWNAVQQYLLEQLKDVGGDPKASDAARVFRLAGSINSKNGAEVHVEYRHGYRYALRDIQYDYLPELTPKPKTERKKPGRRKKVVQLFNIYSLNHARILDITKLVELRNYQVTGYREVICFLYRYWMCCFCNDTEEAYRQTLELNNTFTYPLPERELKSATRSAEKAYEARSNKEANERAIKRGYPGAGYNISNAKLIRWLDITQEEMEHMKTIFNPAEKRRRDRIRKDKERRESGIRTKEQRLEDDRKAMLEKVEKIRLALEENPNLSIRQLVQTTGIPRSTVQRLKKHL
jgi:hypothetical protein